MPQTREGFCVMALWPPTFHLRVVRRSIISPTLPSRLVRRVSLPWFTIRHFIFYNKRALLLRSIDRLLHLCTTPPTRIPLSKGKTHKFRPCRLQNSSRFSTHPPLHTHTQTSAFRQPSTNRDDARLPLAAAYPVRAGVYTHRLRPHLPR